jgi:N-acetylmuramoyl-L-alanine amidase
MRSISYIAVHHSASTFGDAALIRRWHKARGWLDIGYHAVVLNGHREYGGALNEAEIGGVEPGRPEEQVGAHVAGHNTGSLGLCLVGNFEESEPDARQWDAAVAKVAAWCRQYGVGADHVLGHKEFSGQATACPGKHLDMKRFRADVAAALAGGSAPAPEAVASWAKEAWDWAKDAGLLDGTRPEGGVTRQELAAVLYRQTQS